MLVFGASGLSSGPGVIAVEFLPTIPPGLNRKVFMAELEKSIETATDRLVEEGRA